MKSSSNDQADRGRRMLLRTGGVALALGAASGAQAARPTTPTYTISRVRYSIAADAYLPTAGDAYILPLAQVVSSGTAADATLNANNTVTINNAGNYRVILGVDWNSGKGHDAALRSAGIRLRPAGSPAIVAAPGGALIEVTDTDTHLGSVDAPGAATPQTVRFPDPGDGSQSNGIPPAPPYPWTPGTLAPGASVSVDVPMPITGIVAPGDVALPALTSLTDANIGKAAVAALILSAKVVAADTVRVTLLNPSYAPSVTVPQGDLQVLGMSAQTTTGGSSEARTVISSVTMPLNAGDTVYAVFSSLTPGDVMHLSPETYLEVERFTQTS